MSIFSTIKNALSSNNTYTAPKQNYIKNVAASPAATTPSSGGGSWGGTPKTVAPGVGVGPMYLPVQPKTPTSSVPTTPKLSSAGQNYAATLQAPTNAYNPENGIRPPENYTAPGVNTPSTSPTSTAKDEYLKSYRNYIDSLNNSSDIKEAKQAYNDFVNRKDTGLQNIADKRIPMNFITGQQASLEKRAQIEGNRLQGDIGIAQDEYDTRTNAAKMGIDMQKTLYDMEQDEANTAYEREQANYDRMTEAQKTKFDQEMETKKFDEDVRQFGAQYALDKQKANSTGGGGSGTGGYTPGTNPTVDAWAERIQSGAAKITDIPAGQASLRNQVTVALNAMGNSLEGKPTTTELGKAALSTAQELLSKFKSGTGVDAVGTNSLFNAIALPGTSKANFIVDFKSLKDQLSLDGVKYLKGQGAVSDSERALLASAITKLNLKQSKAEFEKTLNGIITKLSGGVSSSQTLPPQMTLNGKILNLQPDGTYK